MKYVGCIAAILAIIFLVNPDGCKDAKTKQELEKVQRELSAATAREDSVFKVNDSLKADGEVKDSLIADAKGRKAAVSAELQQSKQRIAILSRQINEAKNLHDTASIVQNCDSLLQVEFDRTGYIQSLEELADTLTAYYEEQLALKDSIISNQSKLYSDLRTAFNSVSADYIKALNAQPRRVRANAWNRWIKPTLTAIAASIITRQVLNK